MGKLGLRGYDLILGSLDTASEPLYRDFKEIFLKSLKDLFFEIFYLIFFEIKFIDYFLRANPCSEFYGRA